MNTLISILILSFMVSFAAADMSPRLIETGPNKRVWMTFDEITELSKTAHTAGHCGGYIDITEHQNAEEQYLIHHEILDDRLPSFPEIVNPRIEQASMARMLATVEKLSSFKNRYYKSEHGVAAANWIKDQFHNISNFRNDVRVEFFSHSFKQPSVIARIEGRGPHADEIIVLGAHEDSINMSMGFPTNSDTAPGADDDASGVAAVIEAFQVLVESDFQPERSIEFITYAGEERGLLGSMDIAQAYQKAGKKVAAVLQLDMVLHPGAQRKMTFITDHTNKSLTKFTEMLVDSYVKMAWQESKCSYACSDHASWTKAGYASVFPFESTMRESNNKIHTASDTLEFLDGAYGLSFAKLGVAFAIELSLESPL